MSLGKNSFCIANIVKVTPTGNKFRWVFPLLKNQLLTSGETKHVCHARLFCLTHLLYLHAISLFPNTDHTLLMHPFYVGQASLTFQEILRAFKIQLFCEIL